MEIDKELVVRKIMDDITIDIVLDLNKALEFKDNGFVKVESVRNLNTQIYFRDNLNYFLSGNYKSEKDDLKSELQSKNLWEKGFFKELKNLIKEAKLVITQLQ